MMWKDEQYLDEMKKLIDIKALSIEEKCNHLEINRSKYYRLKKILDNPKPKIRRDDQKYIRIENYRDFELYRGIIVEAISRIHDTEEPFQTKKLSSTKLNLKKSQQIISIQEIEDAIDHDKKVINEQIKNNSNIIICSF